MNSIEHAITGFERLKIQINNAGNTDYTRNREIFNDLKTLLIENGFDRETITIDHNNCFFKPPTDFERTSGNPDEKFKDHQGKLAALCTKAIRDLKLVQSKQNNPELPPVVETKIEKQIVYPPTSWKLLRDGLFWTILFGVLSLFCLGFYNLGQNSKESENAALVNETSQRKAELKEMSAKLDHAIVKISEVENERVNLERKLNELKTNN